MDDDTVGNNTVMSGLTNVSPQSTTSRSNAWSDRRRVQQKVSAEVHGTEEMDYKTADQEKMAEIIKENKIHKQEIGKFGDEIRSLKDSLATLRAVSEANAQAYKRTKHWQNNVITTMGKLDTAHQSLAGPITKMAEDNLERDLNMKEFMKQILDRMKPHTEHTAPPANIGFTNNGLMTTISGRNNVVIPVTQQAQTPDPPPHGSGPI